MSEHLALGIDVGSTTTKATLVAVGAEVRELRTATRATAARAERLVDDVLECVRDVVAGGGGEVAAVGVTSMAETGVPLAADGTALTELLRWDAGLGAGEVPGFAADAAALFRATGVRVSAKTPLATWAWLRRERPDVWSRMDRWAGAADLVAHALTGTVVTDHTLAGRTGGFRLPEPGQSVATGFDADLLGLVGLTPDRLPTVAAPDAVAGALTSRAAARLGLPDGVPVVVAGHDHQVAAWAAGVRRAGEVADSLGTAEAVLTVLEARPDLEWVRSQGMSVVRTVAGTGEALISGTSSAGAMLRAWLDGVPPNLREETLARAAAEMSAAPEPTGAAVPPYLRGRQTPVPDPDATAGRPPSEWSLPRQARAVVEGICYQARWMIATQAGENGPREVTVIGGDRLPRLWLDAKRATSPWPVRQVRAAEPAAAGAALLALARSGALGDPAGALLVGPTLSRTEPDSVGSDRHARAFERFVAAVTRSEEP